MSCALDVAGSESLVVPLLVTDQGAKTTSRFLEFFAAQLRNPNTRAAYARAWMRFASWCTSRRFALHEIEPLAAAAYIEELTRAASPSTTKQHLAALRRLRDWLVSGGSLSFNPFSSVRGPEEVIREGKTPVLFADDARQFINAIDTSTLIGLRDKAIVSAMLYSFARVSAVTSLKVRDYGSQGRQAFLRLSEKGGKHQRVPVHHRAAEAIDAYLDAAQIRDDSRAPLFQSLHHNKLGLSGRPLDRRSVWEMVKRRAVVAGFDPSAITSHTWRATGITDYLAHGGSLEHAATIAGHADTNTTQLYNRNPSRITQAEIEKIQI